MTLYFASRKYIRKMAIYYSKLFEIKPKLNVSSLLEKIYHPQLDSLYSLDNNSVKKY